MYMEGKKQAQVECLSQWHLYTVFVACTLLDVMGQILSASLLQFHCFTWHCTDVTESTWLNLLLFLKFLNFFFTWFFYTCSHAWEHTMPQKFKGQLHQITEAFLQVYTVPFQGGLASSPFTLKSRTLHLSTMGSDVRFLLEPINTNLFELLTVSSFISITKVLTK